MSSLKISILVLLTVLTYIALTASLTLPWYYVDVRTDDFEGGDCRNTFFIHWRDVLCESSCGQCNEEKYSWRDGKHPRTARLFDVVGSLIGISAICRAIQSIISILFFSRRWRTFRIRLLYSLLGFVVSCLLCVSLMLFMGLVSRTFYRDNWFCDLVSTYFFTGPCFSFDGRENNNYMYTEMDIKERVSISWGGFGFWIAAMAALPVIVTSLMIIHPFKEEIEQQEKDKEAIQVDIQQKNDDGQETAHRPITPQ
eukprot:TRINITY_DN814_c0_g1_i1.p1 TRINITY_DN814_c0_g1~~TRINITY_DN814_c0_g1_i1.p1  ORF type:complete len:254 (-),score=44.52 TRINITY_DN814_c0_g1_i1:110-871(-)